MSVGTGAFGRIDILVNNAGIVVKPLADWTAEEDEKIVSINVDGFFFMTQAVVPEMLEKGGGHMVNITSAIVEYAMQSIPAALPSLTTAGISAATKHWPRNTQSAASASMPWRLAPSKPPCIPPIRAVS